MRRLLIPLALAAVLGAPAPAAAAGDVPLVRAKAEVEVARGLVDRSVALAEDGDRVRAYALARSAYLDHFEVVEVPLRLRDPALVLDVEFAFAELRDGIRDGAPTRDVDASARELEAGLDSVQRALAEKGIAAPLLALGFSFSILFREGLEAVLLMGIVLGSLEAARASGFRRPIAWGAGAALAATAVVWLVAAALIEVAPVDRELLEAGTALVAMAVLFAVTFWLVAQLEQRRRVEFMRARVSSAVARGSGLAFAGLGFTAVFREGFETVLFYQALALYAHGLWAWILAGALIAAGALVALGYAIFALGRRLPIRRMLVAGASMLLVLSVGFAGNAVRSLQEGGLLPLTPVEGAWARLPLFLAELTGIHPTRESLAAQAALAAVYLAGAGYLFLWKPVRRRRIAEAGA